MWFPGCLPTSGTSWTPTSDLPEGPIYWRVASRDALGNTSVFSAVDSFEIDVTAPEAPSLTAVNPDPTTELRPVLLWSAVSGASDYQVQVSSDSGFATTLFDLTTAGTSWTPTSDLPEGPIYWRAASRDALGNTSAFSAADFFEIDVTAPGAPSLMPVSPDPTTELRPVLSWSAVSGASDYQVQVSSDSGFSSTLFDLTTSGTSWTPTSDLPEGPIYWRVASRDALSNTSVFSAVDSFEIDVTAPEAPSLTAVNPDPTTEVRPVLSWSAVSGASDYQVQVSSDSGFASILFDITTGGSSWTPTSDLPEGLIYWRAASRDALGNTSAFSAADSFEVDVTAPGVPSLTSVSPDPTTEVRPVLSWSAVSGASDYQVQVSSDSGFASVLFDITTEGTSWTPSSDLPEGTVYWRAASRDPLGNTSAFSTADSFEIDVTAPGVPSLTPVGPDPTTVRRPILSWGAVSGASDYQVQVSSDSGFVSTLFDITTAGTSWTPTSDLPEGMIYWRAASRDTVGNTSAFSAADSFEIDVTAPGVPSLTPVNPDPTTELRPVLSWSVVSGASDYQVQVSSDSGFGSTLFDITTAGTSWSPTSDLPEGMIYWRAASRDALGNTSAFSAADSFEIDVTAPEPLTQLRVSWSGPEWFLEWAPSTDSGFAHYAIYRESTPFTSVTGLIPIATGLTDASMSRFIDPAPLGDQDGFYAVVVVDQAGNAQTSVESLAAPGPSPIFADNFESGTLDAWSGNP